MQLMKCLHLSVLCSKIVKEKWKSSEQDSMDMILLKSYMGSEVGKDTVKSFHSGDWYFGYYAK